MTYLEKFETTEAEIAIPIKFLEGIREDIKKYVKVCSIKELSLILNKELEKAGYPKVNRTTFINYYYGNVGNEIKISEDYQRLKEFFEELIIQAKVELIKEYDDLKSADYISKSRIEFLFTHRFKNFGADKEAEPNVKTIGNGNIIINIDNRKLDITQITSESQMIADSEEMVTDYLNERGLNEQQQG